MDYRADIFLTKAHFRPVQERYIGDPIEYPKRTESPLKKDYELIQPILSAISERHEQLEQLEYCLTKDPEHLKYRYQ